MRLILWMVVVTALCATAADAQFAIYAVSNSGVPAGGFLLDNSAGFVLGGATATTGKILAR